VRPMLHEQETAMKAVTPASCIYRDPLTWAIASVVFGSYATLSLFGLFRLNPTTYDLAIFTESVKQYAHFHLPIADAKGAGINLLGEHFSPAVAVLAPVYRVLPSPATLLVAQALLAAASVFAVAAAARARLGAGQARAIALAYGFSWGLQLMIHFEFHEIALAVPLLAYSLSALVQGRLRSCVLWALPLVFVKEDLGFTLAALGLYLIFAGNRADDNRRVWAGQFLLLWGIAWSCLAITVIIPHFNPGHVYSFWQDGGISAGRHPSVLGVAEQFFHAWPVKLQTVVLLLLPTAFAALRSPLALITVPSLLLRFESTNSVFWGPGWHYNATVMPILFIAAIDGLARISASIAADAPDGTAQDDAALAWTAWASGRRGWGRAALAGGQRFGAAMMVAAAVALAFQFPLNGLWNGQTYLISPHVAAANAAMAKVPDGATVQTTLDLLASLAARTDAFWIGNSGNPPTQYIVFDSPNSGYSPPVTNVPAFIAGLYPAQHYTQIFSGDDVYVFRRGW
jgi:uncharacterized membrane protein